MMIGVIELMKNARRGRVALSSSLLGERAGKRMRRRRGLCPPHPPKFSAGAVTGRKTPIVLHRLLVAATPAPPHVAPATQASRLPARACIAKDTAGDCQSDQLRGVRGAAPPASAFLLLLFLC